MLEIEGIILEAYTDGAGHTNLSVKINGEWRQIAAHFGAGSVRVTDDQLVEAWRTGTSWNPDR